MPATGIGRKKVLTGLIVACAIVAILFAVTMYQIFSSVRGLCMAATAGHAGDSVEALIALVESDSASFREKNQAIWALGQIGDDRALPLLKRLDTDEVQSKPYNADAYIVQYSVEKAIHHIESRFSLTRWMYRWL